MIDFNTIARGAHSGFHTASQMVIKSGDKWADVWQQHTSDTVPPPPVPQVDFTHHLVVAVFAGEKHPSTMWSDQSTGRKQCLFIPS